MLQRALLTIITGTVMANFCVSTAGAQNLIPDPEFKKFGYDPDKHTETWKERWIPVQIEPPGECEQSGDSVTVKGGRTFLNSPRFTVEGGQKPNITPGYFRPSDPPRSVKSRQKLNISLSAEGTGRLSVQALYHAANGTWVYPHRTEPVNSIKMEKGKEQRIAGTDDVPEGAAEAYIRIVVEDGTVTVSEPRVTVVD